MCLFGDRCVCFAELMNCRAEGHAIPGGCRLSWEGRGASEVRVLPRSCSRSAFKLRGVNNHQQGKASDSKRPSGNCITARSVGMLVMEFVTALRKGEARKGRVCDQVMTTTRLQAEVCRDRNAALHRSQLWSTARGEIGRQSSVDPSWDM